MKAASNTSELTQLNSELKDLQALHDQAEEDEKAGEIERGFLSYLQKDIGMVSQCWHGGDYQGNGVFAFLGKRGFGKKTEAKHKDYRDAIAQLKLLMQNKFDKHEWPNSDFEHRMISEVTPTLNNAMTPTLAKLLHSKGSR